MDKEKIAIERLQAASQMALTHYETPLLLTDSGGKDSAVCLALAERAGIPFEVLHNHTTADAPETVYTIRQHAKLLEDRDQVHNRLPHLQGATGDNVEPNSTKTNAADPPRPLLLFCAQGKGWKWTLYYNGGTVGGVQAQGDDKRDI